MRQDLKGILPMGQESWV